MEHADYFSNDAVDKQYTISYGDGSLKNEDIVGESMKLNEILCSENQLRFGSCNASRLELTIINRVAPLKDKYLTVSCDVECSETGYQFGVYKVDSDKPTADRRYRDIIAYDSMHDILIADVTAWYNTILPDADSTVTLKEFRDSFFRHFGIEQEDVSLVNDSMIITKTIDPSKLSGKTVITAICEINGCFGHIGRNGKFQYVHLKEIVEGLYPSNTLYPRDDLYPADPKNAEQIKKSHYISAEYEDFETARINKLLIRQEENDIGANYPEGNITDTDNCYIVQDNFLVYGKSTEELTEIAKQMYSVICRVWYRPAHVEAKGNPCLEVGDGIRLSTKYAIIYTYILQRTLSGIQALRDTYDAEGEQYQSENVNSTREEIIQLKGKTNKLTRTLEETRSEITDIEKGLTTKIQQNADAILLEASRAKGAEETLKASIKVEADRITSEVSRAKGAEGTLSSKITQAAESITAEVKRATAAEGDLSSKISMNAESITAEVKRAKGIEGDLSAQISLNAQQILLKVSKDGVVSAINQTAETIKIKAQKIDLEGLVNANEFVSKFATIAALNVTNELVAKRATLEQLNLTNAEVSGKLDASEFTADIISAMSIKVKAANVNGKLSASNIDFENTLRGHVVYIDGMVSFGKIIGYGDVEILGGKIERGAYDAVSGTYPLRLRMDE